MTDLLRAGPGSRICASLLWMSMARMRLLLERMETKELTGFCKLQIFKKTEKEESLPTVRNEGPQQDSRPTVREENGRGMLKDMRDMWPHYLAVTVLAVTMLLGIVQIALGAKVVPGIANCASTAPKPDQLPCLVMAPFRTLKFVMAGTCHCCCSFLSSQ